jgi:hypothetical protein
MLTQGWMCALWYRAALLQTGALAADGGGLDEGGVGAEVAAAAADDGLATQQVSVALGVGVQWFICSPGVHRRFLAFERPACVLRLRTCACFQRSWHVAEVHCSS